MFNKRDDFRTFIIITVVCVICLVIGFVISFKTNTDKLTNVNEYNVFFSNVNYINNYINMVANEKKREVYELLDSNYIKDNNINQYNVLNNNQNYSELSVFEAREMYSVKVKNGIIYYINGNIFDTDHDGSKIINDNFSILILVDTKTNSYSLYPVDDNNYSKIINKIRKVNVTTKKHNNIKKNETINKEQVCIIYLSNFLSVTFNDINKSYNILSDKMKKLYTNNYIYENYINKNFNLMSATADKCKMEEQEENRIYTVIDINGNKYIFEENYVMNYKVDFYLKEE